jgi:HEAT repeat protein
MLFNGSPIQRKIAVNHLGLCRGGIARRALIRTLEDSSAPTDLRGYAAELLHLHEHRETVQACARALRDAMPEVRFWAVYTLGQLKGRLNDRIRSSLDAVRSDPAVAPGWWSVGREAQATLSESPEQRLQLQSEVEAVLADPKSSPEDKRWAECYHIP